MTKRNCYVTDVYAAIEALADALDPARTKPFKGDILDLLEWAERDVLAMRSEIERLKTVPMRYRRMAFNAQLQDENAELRQQLNVNNPLLDEAADELDRQKEEIESLRQQVTLLRDALRELVALNNLKDQSESAEDSSTNAYCGTEYTARKPAAWKAAKEALATVSDL